jgi:hypothetical protein
LPGTLTDRLRARGFSASSLVLRMSREEVGSFLGLKIETVSRTFSKFQASGLLFVRQRQIRITDPVGLQHLLEDAIVQAGARGQPLRLDGFRTISIAPEGHSARRRRSPCNGHSRTRTPCSNRA